MIETIGCNPVVRNRLVEILGRIREEVHVPLHPLDYLACRSTTLFEKALTGVCCLLTHFPVFRHGLLERFDRFASHGGVEHLTSVRLQS